MKEPIFLTLAEVVEIHRNQIHLYGGKEGIRDLSLLQSAIAQPEASFEGRWLNRDHFEMAAAYAYHISRNHPFLDGNKRTALTTALVFLELNGFPLIDPQRKLLNAILATVEGHASKEDLAKILKPLALK